MNFVLLLAMTTQAAEYSARQITTGGVIDIVLTDSKRKQEVRIAPELGNNAYEFKTNGKRVLIQPSTTRALIWLAPITLLRI